MVTNLDFLCAMAPLKMNANGAKRASDGVGVLACVVVWLIFSAVFFEYGPYNELVRLSGAPLLETRIEGYNAETLSTRLDMVGARGRDLYEQFQVLDGANAILMAVALSLLIGFAARFVAGEHSGLTLLALLPAAAGALELGENAALFEAIRSFPASGALAHAAGAITQVKLFVGFGSLILAVLSVVALGFAAVVRRVRRT